MRFERLFENPTAALNELKIIEIMHLNANT